MYIAMNRFLVNESRQNEFEEIWRTRERNLAQFEGHIEFKLLKGDTQDGKTLYSSHVLWRSQQDFINWVESPDFRESHSKKRMPEGVLSGPPRFEGFTVILKD